jgi:hypothetical protein
VPKCKQTTLQLVHLPKLPMQITIDLPEDMIGKLEPLRSELPQILALGLREFQSNPSQGISGLTEILEFLAQLPSPQEILALRLSDSLQNEVEDLLAKSKQGSLTHEEQRLWQQYEFLEHLVRMAKARALMKVQAAS